MAAPNVDLVLVIDASASMKPCFDGLRQHLAKILQPLQGHVSNVEFCVLAQSVGLRGNRLVHDHRFLGCSGAEALNLLYKSNPTQGAPRASFFTSDAQQVARFLADLKPDGNEDLLLALDIAADLPFASVGNTCRVIALFSDEPIEAGAVESGRLDKIPALIDKLQQRRIKLFAAVPESPAALELSQANRSELEFVAGGAGLKGVDFSELLSQMGKSISVMSLQSNGEAPYKHALFGQDRWTKDRSISDDDRESSLRSGESRARGGGAKPAPSPSITRHALTPTEPPRLTPAPSAPHAPDAVDNPDTKPAGVIIVTLVIVKRRSEAVEAIFDVENKTSVNFNQLALELRFFDKQGHFADASSISGRLQPGAMRRVVALAEITLEELGRIELSGIESYS